MKNKTHYCFLKVTPYVYHYLLRNYGVTPSKVPDAVNFSKDPVLRRIITSMIKAPSNRYNKRQLGYKFTKRTCQVSIVVPEATHSGWLLTDTDASDLALILERRCHAIMIAYINMHLIFAPTLKECILDFQKKFGITEEIWSYDTIRRIYNRDNTFDRYNVKNFIFREFNKIYTVQMRRAGLLYQQLNDIENETL